MLEEPPLHVKKHPTLGPMRAIGGAKILSLAGRERQGARVFLRWALSYRTGGTAFDRLPQSLRDAMLDSAAAVMASLTPVRGRS